MKRGTLVEGESGGGRVLLEGAMWGGWVSLGKRGQCRGTRREAAGALLASSPALVMC